MWPLHPDARKYCCRESSRIFRRTGGSGTSNPGEFAGVVSGVGPEAGLEFLRLGVLDGIVPEFNSQFLDYAFLHENLSGGVVGCHPVNL
jgi:hypothetical protein